MLIISADRARSCGKNAVHISLVFSPSLLVFTTTVVACLSLLFRTLETDLYMHSWLIDPLLE